MAGARSRHIPSTIDRLPADVRARIEAMRVAEGAHIDTILAYLHGLGHKVSRTALARHLKHVQDSVRARAEAEMARLSPTIRLANELATSMVSSFGDVETDLKLRAIKELVQSELFRRVAETAAAPEDAEERLGFKDFFVLSRTLQTLEQADSTKSRTRIAEDRALYEQAHREARQQAAQAVQEVARTRGGLTAETVEAIRHAVLGEA